MRLFDDEPAIETWRIMYYICIFVLVQLDPYSNFIFSFSYFVIQWSSLLNIMMIDMS